jgi:3-oxocholest-4-en-26-oate---CoA ligase
MAEPDVATVHEAIADQLRDAVCLVAGGRRLTWTDVTDRSRRLANHLIAHGLGCHTERDQLAGHESGQDHLAIYLHNGNEYLESVLAAFKARVAPVNVNFRYVTDELRYLLADCGATAIVVHSAFAPTLAAVRDALPGLRLILQVAGGRTCRGTPTTSTCCTRAVPPGGPRECSGATAMRWSSASADRRRQLT